MRYELSARQRKELGNGKRLRIALPYPDGGIPGAHRHHDGSGSIRPDALIDWVQRVLDVGDLAYHVLSCDITDVPSRMTQRPAGSLAALLGTVAHLQQDRHRAGFVARIVCVIAEIGSVDRSALRRAYPCQWPLRAVDDDGTRYPLE